MIMLVDVDTPVPDGGQCGDMDGEREREREREIYIYIYIWRERGVKRMNARCIQDNAVAEI